MSSPSTSAVRKQLLRALSLLTADARAARVPLPVPFLSCYGGGDSSSSTSSTSSSSPSSSSNPPILRAVFGDDANDLDASFARLRRLREQLDFLASTPPDVRHSLSLWRDLQEEQEQQGRGGDESPTTSGGGNALLLSAEALAFERGALLLPSIARPPAELELGGTLSSSDDDDDGHGKEEEIMSAEAVSAALDDAALAANDALPAVGTTIDASSVAGVRGLARLLFDGDASFSRSHKDNKEDSSRLFVVPRLRPAAVEWLYDGLAPLFPGSVLRRGQRLVLQSSSGDSGSGSIGVGAGAPIALAAVAAAISRRLGVFTVPVPAEEETRRKANGEEKGGAVSPSPFSEHLSPSVAARMAARTPAAAPETGSWLLACPLGKWVWDPATGEVVVSGDEVGEVERRWPLAGFRRREKGLLLPPLTSADPRLGWAALLRACVVAHTRRGDSDAVAAVLPQLLSLDGDAPEWAQVLRAPEVRRVRR